MSAEATTPPLQLRPSPAVVNALLKWSAEDRRELAYLLLDSVRDGFTSLEEAEQRDKNLIRERIEAYDRGEVKAIDADEMFRRIDAKLAELRRT
jgi:hypothetical protein